MVEIIYFTPKGYFFRKGSTGSTMHASGFIKGLQANGADVSTCVSYREINHPLISNMQPILRPAMYKKMYLSKPRVVVRYAFSKTLEIFLLSLYAKLIGVQLWVEVNSLRKNMIQNRYLKVAIFHLEVLFFSLSRNLLISITITSCANKSPPRAENSLARMPDFSRSLRCWKVKS